MNRTTTLILVAVAAFAPLAAAAIPTEAYCASAEEVAALNTINAHRAEHGLTPLAMSQAIGAAAEHHALDMAANDYYGHDSLDGTTFSQRMTAHGYAFNTHVGENIAAGADAVGTVQQWIASPEHDANLLNPNHAAVGIGVAYAEGSTYPTYWVADFGGVLDAPACGAPAPAPPPEPTSSPPEPTSVPTEAPPPAADPRGRGPDPPTPAPPEPPPPGEPSEPRADAPTTPPDEPTATGLPATGTGAARDWLRWWG